MRYLIIRTENLTKDYHRRRALSNLTLEVEPGEVFGILGWRGAGKSTLINILLDIVHPTSGHALIMGMDCQQQSMQIRRLVGYLPEKITFPVGVNGHQMVNRLVQVRGQVDRDQVLDIAGRFNINLSKPLSACSTSDQRKFGILQAVMHQPDLVLLDNPTQGLEPEAKNELYRLVADLRSQGRAVVFTSSSLSEMERICDRVAFLHYGNLLSIERGAQLRARAVRNVELRFASPVKPEWFSGLSNLNNLVFDRNKMCCTLQGDPDALIKAVSQYRVLDFISQQPSLEEVFQAYYGIEAYAA